MPHPPGGGGENLPRTTAARPAPGRRAYWVFPEALPRLHAEPVVAALAALHGLRRVARRAVHADLLHEQPFDGLGERHGSARAPRPPYKWLARRGAGACAPRGPARSHAPAAPLPPPGASRRPGRIRTICSTASRRWTIRPATRSPPRWSRVWPCAWERRPCWRSVWGRAGSPTPSPPGSPRRRGRPLPPHDGTRPGEGSARPARGERPTASRSGTGRSRRPTSPTCSTCWTTPGPRPEQASRVSREQVIALFHREEPLTSHPSAQVRETLRAESSGASPRRVIRWT